MSQLLKKVKALAAIVVGACVLGANAELVWTKAPYTAGGWTASPANILPSATCKLNGGACAVYGELYDDGRR